MREYRFIIRLPADQALAYYQGVVDTVQAVDLDGRRIRFPARLLRVHITHLGIEGLFALRVDDQNRAIDLRRLGNSQ
ncbi:MAG: DUF2835 domain-containing protein [Candidatus Contendobacter sp.]|nr:DUF2835 domain-containing protein [Candidatus Contendobacter sp.]